MVYTIHSMLYTICYAGHTMVYIIGIYHGILNDIYIRIYHGIYHNIFSLFISHWILVPSSPPGAALFSQQLCRLECSCELQSISLYASAQLDPARLPPPIVPHPVVELIQPASVAYAAYPPTGICSSSSPVSKAVGQAGPAGWDAILVCDPLWSISIINI